MYDYHGESTLYEIYSTQTPTKSTLTKAYSHTRATLAAICLPQSNLVELFIFYCAVYLLTNVFGTLAFHHQQQHHHWHERLIQPTGKTDTLASKIDEHIRTGWANASTWSLDFLDRHRHRSIFGVCFIILFCLFYVSRVAKRKTDEICIHEINGTMITAWKRTSMNSQHTNGRKERKEKYF